jgi:hypothetical protein
MALTGIEDVALRFAVEPDLGRAAALDDEIDLLVHVLFGVESPGAGYLDDIGAPFAFGAVQLDVTAASAHALPWLQRQVLHLADADIAEDRDLFRLHEQVVWRLGTIELAEAGPLEARRLVPVNLAGDLVHYGVLLCDRRAKCRSD